jgi:hypothetical protein
MMTDDELDELAHDIKANGQRFPITRDKDGTILDGRNRLEACNRARVEPKFETLKHGQDPVAFILSANIARRHLSKGQQAMAVAMIYPEPEKGGRGKNAVLNTEFSTASLSHARTVLKFAPDLADSVLSGAVALNGAYEKACDRKYKSESSAERLRNLRASAPDLATLVVEGKLKLPEAEAAHARRQQQREMDLRNTRELLLRIVDYWTQKWPEDCGDIVEALPHIDLEKLLLALQNLKRLIEEKKKQLASKSPVEGKPETEELETPKEKRAAKRHAERLMRKSAAANGEARPPKLSPRQREERRAPGRVHQRFADMITCYCSPVEFASFAFNRGWIKHFVEFEEIPESLIEKFMEPNNWERIKQRLTEHAKEQWLVKSGALL